MTRRADRLFRLVDLLRGRRLAVTAADLAARLEVSPRTVYRDIADLMASGVPVAGEAGVGYRLDPGYELPPVMFSRDEVLAILVGSRLVQAFTDDGLAQAARTAEEKVRAILDDAAKAMAERQPYRVPVLAADGGQRRAHGIVRTAIAGRAKIAFPYRDADGAETRRTVWPLGIIGWTGKWTILAWCELREDYRNFRLDRMGEITVTDEKYPERADRSLAGYMARFVG